MRKRKTLSLPFVGRVPKRAAFVLAALTVLAGMAIATSAVAVSSLAPLRARVLFLERMSANVIDSEALDELIERAKNIKFQTGSEEKLRYLLTVLSELESNLPLPVITSSEQLSAWKNGEVFVVGVVTKATLKEKNFFITVNDVFCPVFGGSSLATAVKVGSLIAVKGKVKEYQGQLEVVPSSEADVLLLE